MIRHDSSVWFLKLGAPVFAAPLAQLFNESLTCGRRRSLHQSLRLHMRATEASDYRPISITPVLSRMFEKHNR